jgi:hypothetical protein
LNPKESVIERELVKTANQKRIKEQIAVALKESEVANNTLFGLSSFAI